MAAIQLIHVQNTISREKRLPRQQLSFLFIVENLHYDKQVEVIWTDEAGEEHLLNAQYQHTQGDGSEQWLAQTEIILSETQALPGNIQFVLHAMMGAEHYWDDNQGFQYQAQADSGYQLAPTLSFWNHNPPRQLTETDQQLGLTFMLNNLLQSRSVTVYWSIDNWVQTQQIDCVKALDYWNTDCKSNARNPNQYGTEVWTASLPVEDAFRVEYCVCCDTDLGKHWFNNDGKNYQLSRQPLKVMILNLHCYQEEQQDSKFSLIARAIEEQEVDVVCFQEVAEYWNEGRGDWPSNSANIINQRLKTPFYLYADWAHLGFEKYREGVAILSRFPLQQQASRYVSASEDAFDIHSRKVVMGQLDMPFFGRLNLYSAHLSWWEDGFEQQFSTLHEWVESIGNSDQASSLLCGDFNVANGSQGYQLVVQQYGYRDQYLQANQQGLTEQEYRVDDAHWSHLQADDYRIDFIFMQPHSRLKVIAAQTLFTEQDYGRVSDHCGYVMTFEPK